jgi:hypothetical protein
LAWTRGRNRGVRLFVLLACWSPGAVAGAPLPLECPTALVREVPARPGSAPKGSEFAAQVAGQEGASREAAIEQALLDGNVPAFLRRLKPVTLTARQSDGSEVTATLCVTPDYVAIGSDDDFLRIPADLHTATAVASRFGFILPTRKMVDAIYQQSEVHLSPQPMTPGPKMRSTAYYVTHNRHIMAQRGNLGVPLGRGKIAIYGWHRLDGRPIQPLSTVHGAGYADYSHGIRLVSEVVFVNGEAISVYDVLQDPALAPLLSDEGTVDNLSELIPPDPVQVARLERAVAAYAANPPEAARRGRAAAGSAPRAKRRTAHTSAASG